MFIRAFFVDRKYLQCQKRNKKGVPQFLALDVHEMYTHKCMIHVAHDPYLVLSQLKTCAFASFRTTCGVYLRHMVSGTF